MGCPIRTPVDQRFFAAPHGFSQLSTSFIAIACLGIHRTPLLTFPCMACTIAVHATQAMSSILCYLAYYYLSYFICAGPEGPAHPLLSNMSKNTPLAQGSANVGASIPGPAHSLYQGTPCAWLASINKQIISIIHNSWSYRDSNPGPLPCKGSALAS